MQAILYHFFDLMLLSAREPGKRALACRSSSTARNQISRAFRQLHSRSAGSIVSAYHSTTVGWHINCLFLIMRRVRLEEG